MVLDGNGSLSIIDFNRWSWGDPWEEFNRVTWCAQAAPDFARGRIDGYFDGDVLDDFFPLLALYIAVNLMGAMTWSIPFGQKEIDVTANQAAEVLAWFDGMKNPVPTWYRQQGLVERD
jgi:serine/threonine-protein kinase